MKKVVVLQHRLLHYRTGLFERLRTRCREAGIDLHLVHGQPTGREEKKTDVGSLPWAEQVRNRYVAVGRRDVLWQPFPRRHEDAELVVMMQENRLLSNYPRLFFRGNHMPRVAFWGHGRNLQSERPGGLLEAWKKLLVGRVDWWFAYTDLTREIILQDGYPAERITVLDNAIDNERFEADLTTCSPDRLNALKQELGLVDGALIGLFCGSLYADKRLGFMLDAADRIWKAFPEFHLVVIGDGPNAHEIQEAQLSRPWLHWVGVRKGVEKAAYFRIASLVFNPGAVGLHVLDSFCAGVPMATTSEARHGPEAAYLADGHNGLMVSGSAEQYASAVIRLLSDKTAYETMRTNALADAKRYTLDNMVERFAEGIERCLAAPKKP